MFFTKQDNYSGVLDTVPFTDCDGYMIVIPSDGHVPAPKNCYMCPEVWAFYKAAAETPKALLLDVMSPRVLATANNFERSKIIQARFKHVCFVVVTGSEIRVLKPRKQDFGAPRKLNSVKIGDVLTELDKEMPRTPIFVLGYSKMERSISYRADARVPTHMAVSIGGELLFIQGRASVSCVCLESVRLGLHKLFYITHPCALLDICLRLYHSTSHLLATVFGV